MRRCEITHAKAAGRISIAGDANGNVTVYSADGVVILRDAPAAQLRTLEKGLYIINGKKTILK